MLECPYRPEDTITPTKDTSQSILEELIKAITLLKNRIADRIEAIPADILKSNINTTAKILHQTIKNSSDRETRPLYWIKGLIVKLLQKGEMREIILLSVPSQVLIFCKFILSWIDASIDERVGKDILFSKKYNWTVYRLEHTIINFIQHYVKDSCKNNTSKFITKYDLHFFV